MKSTVSSTLLFLLALAVPALASVTVSSPGSGADVSSPFNLSAYSSTCSDQTVAAMGYSFDSSTDTTIMNGTSVNANVTSATGTHTLHVKSWGNKGGACVTDVVVTVTAANSSVVPSDAVSVSAIQTLGNWTNAFDTGTNGSSSGAMSLVGSPSRSGHARKLVTNYQSNGGERYWVSFGDDSSSTNFFYDAWFYLPSSSNLANLELDMNQTMPNGQTAIFGFQCDGWSGTWDYTENAGTPQKPVDHWLHSNAACNPRSWSINTWHHVQVYYSRDSSGHITYRTVWLDDEAQQINATVLSAFALGWGPSLLTNIQVDGLGSSGSTTVYVDDMTVYRW